MAVPLANVVGSQLPPVGLLGVPAPAGWDLLPIDDEVVAVGLNAAPILAVDGVVLELVGHVIRGGRASVDGVQRAILIVHHDACHQTANAAEAVNT